jgi:hypothetical protein
MFHLEALLYKGELEAVGTDDEHHAVDRAVVYPAVSGLRHP